MKAIEIFNKNIERCEALVDIHRATQQRGRQPSHGELADILRAVVIFEVAAIDSYFHHKILEKVEEIIEKGSRLSEKCVNRIAKNFRKENLAVELLAIAFDENRKQKILELLKNVLKNETFQKPEKISEALEMMGTKNPWSKINKRTSRGRGRTRLGRFRDSRKFIKELAEKRDNITHEGDFYPQGRRYHGRLRPIKRSKVEGTVERLKSFIQAIEAITTT